MATYTIPPVSGDLTNAALRIESKIGKMPDYWGTNNLYSWFGFDSVLTGNQEFLLTGLLNGFATNYQPIPPATGNTRFRIWDVMDNRAQIERKMGLNFELLVSGRYSSDGATSGVFYIMDFDKVLNQSEKNRVQNTWAGLLVEMQ